MSEGSAAVMAAPAVTAASGHSPSTLDYYDDYNSTTTAPGMAPSFIEHSGIHLTSYNSAGM